jgi:hypothetical protein
MKLRKAIVDTCTALTREIVDWLYRSDCFNKGIRDEQIAKHDDSKRIGDELKDIYKVITKG